MTEPAPVEDVLLPATSKTTQEPPSLELLSVGGAMVPDAGLSLWGRHEVEPLQKGGDLSVSGMLEIAHYETAHHSFRLKVDAMGPPSEGEFLLWIGYRGTLQAFDRRVSDQAVRGKILAKLEILQKTVSMPDWDGEGADPVTADTFQLARTFVDQLPADTTAPVDVAATPQGEVELSWEGEGGSFDLLVLPSGELAISGIYGPLSPSTGEGMNLYGTADWDQQSLPEFVVSGLSAVGSPTGK